MLSFIGDYTCKLDSKGRGVVPAVFRKEMQAVVNLGGVLGVIIGFVNTFINSIG